jgi:hypothetical protein
MTNIWTPTGNRVAALAPGPGDLFVVTTIGGKRVLVEPIDQYERAIRIAESFARQMAQARPFSIKVLCMSFPELLAHMGTTREECAKLVTPEEAESDRRLAISTCMDVLRTSNDAQVRADALDVLTSMGVLKQ